MKLKVLSHDPPRGLEGELQDVLVVVSGGEVEDGGDVDGPACGPCWPHTSPLPPCDHVPHRRPLVVLHYLLEGSQK